MNNTWLKQIFKNEGDILGAFVSSKQRKNKEGQFCFVKFKREREASEAIYKNNGLLIKGNKIRVSWAKYHNGKPISLRSRVDPRQKDLRASREQKKAWKPAFRDGRSYK